MRVAKSLNLERESSEHLRCTHLQQVQHCTDLPRQITFLAHTKQGKMGPGLGRTLPLIKRTRRIRRRRRASKSQEKGEDRLPILEKMCVALLRSFRGQHGKKWFQGSAQGNWDLQEGQQPFRPNPNGVGDCTTTLKRLFIGADYLFLAIRYYENLTMKYIFFIILPY